MNLGTLSRLILSMMILVAGCNRPPELKSLVKTESVSKDSAIRFDWPNLYGPEQIGVSRESHVTPVWSGDSPRQLWSRAIGKGYTAPIIINDKLIIAYRVDDQEIVECLDAINGDSIWEHRYPTHFESSYEYSNGPYSTAVANQSHVFFVGGQGQFFCFEIETGAIVWQRNLLVDYGVELNEWPVTCSPLLLDDRIIFNVGASDQDAGIVAFDLSNGRAIWEATDHHWAHATPVIANIHDQNFLFVVTREGLVCLDPKDGNVHWTVRHQTRRISCYNAVSPAIWNDLVCFVTGPNTGIRCFQIQPDGSYIEPWKNRRLLDSQYTNLICTEGYLFGFMSTGQGGPDYKCIDMRTGKLAYKAKPKVGRGTQLAVGKYIVLFGENGELATIELNAKAFKEICHTEQPLLEKPCYTSPSLANGRMYLRNEKQLICLDLRPDPKKSSDDSQ